MSILLEENVLSHAVKSVRLAKQGRTSASLSALEFGYAVLTQHKEDSDNVTGAIETINAMMAEDNCPEQNEKEARKLMAVAALNEHSKNGGKGEGVFYDLAQNRGASLLKKFAKFYSVKADEDKRINIDYELYTLTALETTKSDTEVSQEIVRYKKTKLDKNGVPKLPPAEQKVADQKAKDQEIKDIVTQTLIATGMEAAEAEAKAEADYRSKKTEREENAKAQAANDKANAERVRRDIERVKAGELSTEKAFGKQAKHDTNAFTEINPDGTDGERLVGSVIGEDTLATAKGHVEFLISVVEPNCIFDPTADGVSAEEVFSTFNRLFEGFKTLAQGEEEETTTEEVIA